MFLFFSFPGTFLPGQHTAKLFYIKTWGTLGQFYAKLTNPQGSGEDFVKTIRFLTWKFNYLKKNVNSIMCVYICLGHAFTKVACR